MTSAYGASGDIVDDEGALRQERQGGVIELDQITSSFFHRTRPMKRSKLPGEVVNTASPLPGEADRSQPSLYEDSLGLCSKKLQELVVISGHESPSVGSTCCERLPKLSKKPSSIWPRSFASNSASGR